MAFNDSIDTDEIEWENPGEQLERWKIAPRALLLLTRR
jgi:hypothetical protein